MKGQAALEYLLTISIALAIFSPLMFFVTQRSQETNRELEFRALQDSLNSLVETADLVHSQGYPAQSTVFFRMPDGVVSTTITDGNVIIEVKDEGGITSFHDSSSANLVGSLPNESGNYEFEVRALENGNVEIER